MHCKARMDMRQSIDAVIFIVCSTILLLEATLTASSINCTGCIQIRLICFMDNPRKFFAKFV